jgi:tetratricopeptide (TPR) repeat protein
MSIFQRYQAVDAQINPARQALKAHRFAEAQRLLAPCLHLVPEHFEAHFLLAQMAYEGRDYAGALAHVETAERSLAGLDRRYREERADLKAQAEAEQLATQSGLDNLYARGVDPNGCSAILFQVKRQALAYLEAQKGHLHDRENPFGVPADYHFLHGICLYRLAQRSGALVQYQLAVEAEPTHASAWNNLIALHLEARDLDQARACLSMAEAAGVTVRPALKQAVNPVDTPVR